jgi:nicotinate-nucleotide pyrophosphorylase
MTVLTKQDLQDWNSHPVTRAISKKLEEQCNDVRSESCLRETCDQTAMQAARNEGMIEGIEMLNEAYEDMLSEASE